MPNKTVECYNTLIIKIFLKGVDKAIKEHLMQGILIRVNESPLYISNDNNNANFKDKEDMLVITYRDTFNLKVESNILEAPYDIIAAVFKIEMTSKEF